jgi:hypothetical protein
MRIRIIIAVTLVTEFVCFILRSLFWEEAKRIDKKIMVTSTKYFDFKIPNPIIFHFESTFKVPELKSEKRL